MADTSLIFRIIASEHVSGALDKIKRNAEATGAAVAKALAGPALLPALATGAAGVAGFGVAIASAGAAFGVFGAVAKKATTEVTENATKLDDLRQKAELAGEKARQMAAAGQDNAKYLKQQSEAILEINARIALMPAPMRNAVIAQQDMKQSWEGFVDKNKPAVFGTLASGYKLIGSSVSRLQPLFDIGKRGVDRLVGSLQKAVDGGFIERMSARAGPAMDSLVGIITNVSRALGGMMGRFAGQGQGILVWLDQATAKWAVWANSTSTTTGMGAFMEYVTVHGPTVLATFTNLAQAAIHIAQAVTPLAPVSLAIASALASLVSAVPPGLLTVLVGGFLAINVALRLGVVWTMASSAAMAIWGKRAVLQGVYARAAAAGTKLLTAAQWLLNAALTGVKWVWAVAQLVAYKTKQLALAAASKIAAAAQWLWNAALVGAGWFAATAQMAAYAIKQGAIIVATKAAAAAQVLWNIAMSISPVGLVIIAIIALIAVFVLLWNKSAAFRQFWITVWRGIVSVATAVWTTIRTKVMQFWQWLSGTMSNIVSRVVTGWNTVRTKAGQAWDFIWTKASNIANRLMGIPGRISNRLRSTFDGLWIGFRAIANRVISGWNNLYFEIGGGSFMGVSIPSFRVDTPNIPSLNVGTSMVRASGLAMIHRGESITPAARVTPYRSTSSSGGATITINGSNAKVVRVLLELLRDGIRDNGGDVVKVLTPR